jgi:hypothetical protein
MAHYIIIDAAPRIKPQGCAALLAANYGAAIPSQNYTELAIDARGAHNEPNLILLPIEESVA